MSQTAHYMNPSGNLCSLGCHNQPIRLFAGIGRLSGWVGFALKGSSSFNLTHSPVVAGLAFSGDPL